MNAPIATFADLLAPVELGTFFEKSWETPGSVSACWGEQRFSRRCPRWQQQ